jgi:hypothetical protein
MYCILNAIRKHFEFVGLEPQLIDRHMFDKYILLTQSKSGLFGPVAAAYVAHLAVERGDFRPYVYYLNDPFHGLEDMCDLANEDEKPFVQPELFDFPFLPWGEPCVACDVKTNHAYFTQSLAPDKNSLIVMAIQIARIR